MKKVLTMLLSVVMVLCMMPGMAFADDVDGSDAAGEDQIYVDPEAAENAKNTYKTLGAAIDAVKDKQTIVIAKDIKNAVGLKVPSSKNFTIDFKGHDYILVGPGAGSTNTETNGFQLLKNSTITFKNGTIRIAENANNIKRIIQNYADLTLENMQFYSENQVGGEDYALSFNNGNITFKGNTSIYSSDADVIAFDVCKFSNYPNTKVTFDEKYTGTINGKIVYDAMNAETHKLSIKGSGKFGEITVANETTQGEAAKNDGILIYSGSFKRPVLADYCAENYAPLIMNNGTCEVKLKQELTNYPNDENGNYFESDDALGVMYAAKVGKAYYATLEEAIENATTDETVTLLKDVTLDAQLTIDKKITLDGAENTINISHTDTTPEKGGGILVTGTKAIGTIIKDVTVSGPHDGKVWKSNQHGIKVWNGADATLENVTVEKSSTAIQVGRDSKVTLSGTVNLHDNVYNGIEIVEKNADTGSKSGQLTVSKNTTFTNKDTLIWMDGPTEGSHASVKDLIIDNSGKLQFNADGTLNSVTKPSTGGGGGYIPPTVQKPTIEPNDDITTVLGADGTTLTIKVKDGYELVDVTVNGVSKGAVDKLTGLKTGDVVKIITKKIETDADKDARIKAGVKATTIKAWSERTNKGIKVSFKKSYGFKVDGYEIYRSTKKGTFGEKPYYVSKNAKAKYLHNTKNLKKGKMYFYKVRGYRTVDGEKVYTQWSNQAIRRAK